MERRGAKTMEKKGRFRRYREGKIQAERLIHARWSKGLVNTKRQKGKKGSHVPMIQGDWEKRDNTRREGIR